jgi:hypothetical protein
VLLAVVLGALALSSSGHGGLTLHAGTKLQTHLARTVDASTARVDQPIVFRVVPPYPRGARSLANATVTGFITSVTRPKRGEYARIEFLFSRIMFSSGESEPIAAYVDDRAFTGRNLAGLADIAPQIAVAPTGATPSIPTLGGPKQAANLLEVTIGAKPRQQTGGFVYAARGGEDIELPAGRLYTLELAQQLTVPATIVLRHQAQ